MYEILQSLRLSEKIAAVLNTVFGVSRNFLTRIPLPVHPTRDCLLTLAIFQGRIAKRPRHAWINAEAEYCLKDYRTGLSWCVASFLNHLCAQIIQKSKLECLVELIWHYPKVFRGELGLFSLRASKIGAWKIWFCDNYVVCSTI